MLSRLHLCNPDSHAHGAGEGRNRGSPFGGAVHDLGKLTISRSILRKAVSLNQDEQLAANDTKSMNHFSAGLWAGCFPCCSDTMSNLKPSTGDGDTVPLGARILAVADVYDTMTVHSPYRKACSRPRRQKKKSSAGAGTKFDPEVVKAFVTAFNRMEMELPNIIL